MDNKELVDKLVKTGEGFYNYVSDTGELKPLNQYDLDGYTLLTYIELRQKYLKDSRWDILTRMQQMLLQEVASMGPEIVEKLSSCKVRHYKVTRVDEGGDMLGLAYYIYTGVNDV